MEVLIHNLNTMHSRAGAQVPFRLYQLRHRYQLKVGLIEQLLLATKVGLGNGETPIFPIQIFRVKEGVNYNPSDPNYDLFQLAMETSAKRLFLTSHSSTRRTTCNTTSPIIPKRRLRIWGCRTRVMGKCVRARK